METKSWYASKTIWGLLITAAATVLQLFGVADISSTEQGSIADSLVNFSTAAGQIVGIILAIVGRVKATGPIGG